MCLYSTGHCWILRGLFSIKVFRNLNFLQFLKIPTIFFYSAIFQFKKNCIQNFFDSKKRKFSKIFVAIRDSSRFCRFIAIFLDFSLFFLHYFFLFSLLYLSIFVDFSQLYSRESLGVGEVFPHFFPFSSIFSPFFYGFSVCFLNVSSF